MTDGTVTVLRDGHPVGPDVDAEERLAAAVNEALRESVQAIFRAGRRLIGARDELPDGRFKGWCEEKLPISPATATKLMKIAASDRLQSVSRAKLPSARRTLYKLSTLDEEEWGLVAPQVHPEMQRHEVKRILRRKRAEEVQDVDLPPRGGADAFDAARGTFKTVVADPPWQFAADESGPDALPWGRHVPAACHYPQLDMDAIRSLPVDELAAPDAYLWLWTPAQHFRTGLAQGVAEAWGFTVRAERVWIKPTLGAGYWIRHAHEYVLLATRGTVDRFPSMRSTFEAPNRGHSVKPQEFYTEIEGVCPGPRLDLFARSEREGWTAWGGEVGDTVGIGFDPERWKVTGGAA